MPLLLGKYCIQIWIIVDRQTKVEWMQKGDGSLWRQLNGQRHLWYQGEKNIMCNQNNFVFMYQRKNGITTTRSRWHKKIVLCFKFYPNYIFVTAPESPDGWNNPLPQCWNLFKTNLVFNFMPLMFVRGGDCLTTWWFEEWMWERHKGFTE